MNGAIEVPRPDRATVFEFSFVAATSFRRSRTLSLGDSSRRRQRCSTVSRRLLKNQLINL
ncbi:unnamed protein product [Arabidopsis lyrata]|uniref:Uncharacterized protein n=1 Tax=Arabidopsis lyrata subsp. lyrata TaxID=81972 RepID=D7KUH6_ARALL|nr:hypothetical protein ARALYDRAFT_895616 [Arabidopsis lyrata subsp. lyrata]CAH8258444.1 unnamed protein product [Arabidopsis lyrata]